MGYLLQAVVRMYKDRLPGKEDNRETTRSHTQHAHRDEERVGLVYTSLFQTRPVVWYFLT